jgi:hypothetical protein
VKKLTFYLLVIAIVPLIMAADEYSPPDLIIPKDNGLKLISNGFYDAKFSGQIQVSGTVTAQMSGGIDDDPGKPELILVPDEDSLKRLPYFTRYEIKGIVLTNYDEAVLMVFGKDIAKKMTAKGADNRKTDGSFLIKDYEVGIECDYPFADATLVSANIPPKVADLGKHVMAYCG